MAPGQKSSSRQKPSVDLGVKSSQRCDYKTFVKTSKGLIAELLRPFQTEKGTSNGLKSMPHRHSHLENFWKC